MIILANDLIKNYKQLPTYSNWPKEWSLIHDSILYQWYYFTKYYERDNYEIAVIEDNLTPWGFAFQVTAYYINSREAVKDKDRVNFFYAYYGDSRWDIPIFWITVVGKKALKKLK